MVKGTAAQGNPRRAVKQPMTISHPNPVVIVPGIGQSRVFLADDQGQRIKSAWPLDVDAEALLSALKGPAMKMIMFRRDAGFSDKVAEQIRTAIEPLALTPEGKMAHNIVTERYPCLAQCTPDARRYIFRMVPCEAMAKKLGEENVWYFAYNPFGDPYALAAELDALIGEIKASRGADKVNILSVSLGGALTTAYFDAYGAKGDVERVVYMVAALQGTRLIADLFEKNVQADDFASVVSLFADGKTTESLRGMMKLLPAGVSEALTEKCLDTLLDAVLARSPMIWSVLPPAVYPAMAERYLSDGAYAVLRQKTDRFHAAQSRLRALLKEREANGTSFYLCVGYGRSFPALSKSRSLCSDGVIDLFSASLGAKGAAPGERLPENEIGDRAYLSPDGTVDASFGAFPDSTWYFADQQHDDIAYNDTALAVAARALCDPDFHDIHSDPALGQFGKAQDNRRQNADSK